MLDEKDDFDQLSREYIGSRYIKDYELDKPEIERWKTEAKKLLTVTGLACKVRIKILKQLEKGKTDNNTKTEELSKALKMTA